MSSLYITQNGITDHIDRSQQVAPYLLELARQGYRIHVLSAEKAGQNALIAQYQKLFDDAGITLDMGAFTASLLWSARHMTYFTCTSQLGRS